MVNDLFTLVGLCPPDVMELYPHLEGKGNFPVTTIKHSEIFKDLLEWPKPKESEI